MHMIMHYVVWDLGPKEETDQLQVIFIYFPEKKPREKKNFFWRGGGGIAAFKNRISSDRKVNLCMFNYRYSF